MELSKTLGKHSPTGIHGQYGIDAAEPWATEQPPGPAMLLLFARTTLLSSFLAREQPLKGLQHKLLLCLSGPVKHRQHPAPYPAGPQKPKGCSSSPSKATTSPVFNNYNSKTRENSHSPFLWRISPEAVKSHTLPAFLTTFLELVQGRQPPPHPC